MMCNHIIENPDLYVYTTFKKRGGEGDGVIWVCHHCCFASNDAAICDTVMEDKGDLLVHLAKHQEFGHDVPDRLLNQLASEIAKTTPSGKLEEPVTIMNLGGPPWEEHVHRPTVVTAFQWEPEMEDCVPQIHRENNEFIMHTHWGYDRPMRSGDWVVRNPRGDVWLVDRDMFNRFYDPRFRKG